MKTRLEKLTRQKKEWKNCEDWMMQANYSQLARNAVDPIDIPNLANCDKNRKLAMFLYICLQIDDVKERCEIWNAIIERKRDNQLVDYFWAPASSLLSSNCEILKDLNEAKKHDEALVAAREAHSLAVADGIVANGAGPGPATAVAPDPLAIQPRSRYVNRRYPPISGHLTLFPYYIPESMRASHDEDKKENSDKYRHQ